MTWERDFKQQVDQLAFSMESDLDIEVEVLAGGALPSETLRPVAHPAEDLRWLRVLERSLGHEVYLLSTRRNGLVTGRLPLALVKGPIFGRFLVSLPYLNSGGVQAEDQHSEKLLIDKAIELADQLNCRYLELRHERPLKHEGFNAELTSKVHLRLTLPADVATLRKNLKSSVRNQVKKGERQQFSVEWGGEELLEDFYSVFARRMRDLGTPVFSRRLFAEILTHFHDCAEICCVRDGRKGIAAALLVHGYEVTEVPSASSLVQYNHANANMFMYWNLLTRSVERGQRCFDFGRSTIDGPTYKFKKQWGSEVHPATWQYYLRQGSVEDMRPDSGKKQLLIEGWKRLPVWLTKLMGPSIVRGIP